MTEWIKRDENNTNNPTENGIYAVMVEGDSEYIDGHCVYSFDAYQTFAVFTLDEDGGAFHGDGDEEDFTIFAYFGPIIIPEYKDD